MTHLKLTSIEEAILLGTLLGDGHIQKRGNSFRSKICHCEKHKQYVDWKYKHLKRLCDNNHEPKTVYDKNNFASYFFYLQSGTYLEPYHTLFYHPYVWTSKKDSHKNAKKPKIKYKKKITQTLIENLPNDALLLAVWFLDDGSCRTNVFSGRIATQGFSKDEQFLLQQYLLQGFGIKTQVVLHNRLKQQYYLSIPGKNNNFANFVDLVKPTVNSIDCMKYKIKNPRND